MDKQQLKQTIINLVQEVRASHVNRPYTIHLARATRLLQKNLTMQEFMELPPEVLSFMAQIDILALQKV